MKSQTGESHTETSRQHLLRILGAGFGLAIIIGNTVGSGILHTPGDIAAMLPKQELILGVWVVGGLYAMLGAISLSELGTAIPLSGGQYVFAHRALGDYAGFVVGWSDWLSTCGATAAVSLLVGEYTCALFPVLGGHTVIIALSVAFMPALLQWKGIVWGSVFQDATSLIKGLLFLLFIVAAFAFGRPLSGVTGSVPVYIASVPLAIGIIGALKAVIYTYDGWSAVVYFSEEVRDPGRNIVRSTIMGVVFVIVLYLLVNVALLHVLPISQIAGNDLAVGLASTRIFGNYGDTIIRVIMIVSLVSSINAYHLMASRVLFAMGRDGLFIKSSKSVNDGGTPAVALFIGLFAAVCFILRGSFDRVLTLLTFFFVANYTLSFLSLFVLRFTEPSLDRPYKAWGYPITTGIVLLGSIAFLAAAIVADRLNSLYSLGILVLSYPVYLVVKRLARSATN